MSLFRLSYFVWINRLILFRVVEAPLAKEEIGLTELSMRHSPTASEKSFEALYGPAKLWLGKDYTNFIVKDFTDLDVPFQGETICFHHRSGGEWDFDGMCVICRFGGSRVHPQDALA